MNSAEHITECYFRVAKTCFTLSDVKVINGVNRQIDLLAVNLSSKDQYHVEASVTHRKAWAPDVAKLEQIFRHKFLGMPNPREGKKSDHALGRSYLDQINATYKSVGLDPQKIQRVFVCWIVKDQQKTHVALEAFREKHGLSMSVVSFRDVVLPALLNSVKTTNYDDEVLRSFSFLKQREIQIRGQNA